MATNSLDSASVVIPSQKRGISKVSTAVVAASNGAVAKKPRVDSNEDEDNYWEEQERAELALYDSQKDRPELYKPGTGKVIVDQLHKAALEFKHRCDEAAKEDSEIEEKEAAKEEAKKDAEEQDEATEEESVPYVLVSTNCKDMPSRDLELKALKSTEINKLWYVLTTSGSLLIVKISSDGAHATAVAELVSLVRNFAVQYDRSSTERIFDSMTDGKVLFLGGKVAPDAVLQRNYPTQQIPRKLNAPLIIELEVGNRCPKALMEQLSSYLTVTNAARDYVLGIKVYPRTQPPVAAGGKHRFAAIALLWRLGPAAPQPRQHAQLVCVRSFGTCALSNGSIAAFCTKRGRLQTVRPQQIVHPSTTDIIIPAAELVRGTVDAQGVAVNALPNGNDLVIDLNRIRSICDDNLPL